MATVTQDPPVDNWQLPADAADLAIDDGRDCPADGRLPLAEALEVHAAYFRSLGTTLGDWLALVIDEKAADARRYQAATVEQLDERAADEELSYEHDLWERAHTAGYDACVRAHYLDSCYCRAPVVLPPAAQAAHEGYAPFTAEAREAHARFLASIPRKTGGRDLAPLD